MQTGKIGRKFRPESKDLVAHGMLDRQYMGMKSLSAKGLERFPGFDRQKRDFGAKS